MSFLRSLAGAAKAVSPGFRFDLRKPLLEQALQRKTWEGGQMMMPGGRPGLKVAPPGVGPITVRNGRMERMYPRPEPTVTPRPPSKPFSYSPPPLSKSDQNLALALSKKPKFKVPGVRAPLSKENLKRKYSDTDLKPEDVTRMVSQRSGGRRVPLGHGPAKPKGTTREILDRTKANKAFLKKKRG